MASTDEMIDNFLVCLGLRVPPPQDLTPQRATTPAGQQAPANDHELLANDFAGGPGRVTVTVSSAVYRTCTTFGYGPCSVRAAVVGPAVGVDG